MTMGQDTVTRRQRVTQAAPNWNNRDQPLGWYKDRMYRVNFGTGGSGYSRWQEFMRALSMSAMWLERESRQPHARHLRRLKRGYRDALQRELNGLAWYADIRAQDYALVTHALRNAGMHLGKKDKWYLMLRTYGKPSPRNRRPNAGWWHPDPAEDGLA
jgi:hypothetical protein